jgi:hypothetical protein
MIEKRLSFVLLPSQATHVSLEPRQEERRRQYESSNYVYDLNQIMWQGAGARYDKLS